MGLRRSTMFPGPSELIIILIIAVLVFGPKKIPEIMSSLGKGIRIFKKSMESEDMPPSPSQSEHSPPAPEQLISQDYHTPPGEKTGTQ
jgi:sec-independent protein translocase protein TatA